jgi:hypothetical protein
MWNAACKNPYATVLHTYAFLAPKWYEIVILQVLVGVILRALLIHLYP